MCVDAEQQICCDVVVWSGLVCLLSHAVIVVRAGFGEEGSGTTLDDKCNCSGYTLSPLQHKTLRRGPAAANHELHD
jgi:hypothetical protein